MGLRYLASSDRRKPFVTHSKNMFLSGGARAGSQLRFERRLGMPERVRKSNRCG